MKPHHRQSPKGHIYKQRALENFLQASNSHRSYLISQYRRGNAANRQSVLYSLVASSNLLTTQADTLSNQNRHNIDLNDDEWASFIGTAEYEELLLSIEGAILEGLRNETRGHEDAYEEYNMIEDDINDVMSQEESDEHILCPVCR
jgi:hypothetical protein